MEKTIDLFFSMIKCAVHGESADEAVLADLDDNGWAALFETAAHTKLVAVLYPVLEECGAFGDMKEKWQKATRASILRQMEMTRAVYAILKESAKRGISPVFIKGAVLADLYPHYSQRRSGDIDILVTDGEKDESVKMFDEMGYSKLLEHSKNHVQVFSSGNPRSVIELHTRLWEDYEGHKIDILETLNLGESCVSVKVCGFDMLTLEPTRHLVYQMFHIVKHFILDSIGARYLVDISLFIEKYRDQIDFKIFGDSMESLGYTQFCRRFFNLCRVYLGLDTSFFMEMESEPYLDEESRIFMSDIMGGGVKAGEGQHGWQLMGYMTPYLVGEKKMRKTALGRKFDTIFLRPGDLQGKFTYAKKYKFLLPVAWVHRAADFVIKYRRHKDNLHSASEKLSAAEYRVYLLNRLGLIDGKK